MNPFSTVKDSSIWHSSSNFSAFKGKDALLRMGIIKRVYQDTATTELRYLVTMFERSDEIELNCRLMRRFGGVFNYEDIVYQGYTFTDAPDPVSTLNAKAGDIVLVAFLNGEGREGIILGGIMHPARTSTIDINDGPQYMSEFNGVQTVINQNGEYTVTFRGIPTNIAELANIPSDPLPAPTYDTTVGSSFFKMNQTGGLELSDNSTSGVQNLVIDKAGGIVSLNAGSASIVMNKGSQQIDITGQVVNVSASTISIGSSSVELLSQIVQALQAINQITIDLSPIVGAPVSATGPGSQLQTIISNIQSLMG